MKNNAKSAGVLKTVFTVVEVLNIIVFVIMALMFGFSIFIDEAVEITDDSALFNVFNVVGGGNYDVTLKDIVIAYLPLAVAVFTSIFIFEAARRYFAASKENGSYLFGDSVTYLIKISAALLASVILPLITSLIVSAVLPSEIFNIKPLFNQQYLVLALVVIAIAAAQKKKLAGGAVSADTKAEQVHEDENTTQTKE